MLQAYIGEKMVVGVTRGNVTRLADQNKPLIIKLQKSVTEIMVVFGETKPDILRQLETAGAEIPNVVRLAAEADPS